MLDFTKRKRKYYELKLTEDEILYIKMPSKELYETLSDTINWAQGELGIEEAMDGCEKIENIVNQIISNNTAGKEVDVKNVIMPDGAKLDLKDCIDIITDYMTFTLRGLKANPNLKSPIAQPMTTMGD